MQYTKNMPRRFVRLTANQAGFASIVIALTIIIVMALISVGFAELSSREQQDSLNNQLANEATYAAESGINQGVAELTKEAAAGHLASKTSCGPDMASTYLKDNILDGTGDVQWTCLTIDTVLPTLVYSDVPVDKGTSVGFYAGSANGFHTFTIQWSSSGRADNFITTPGSPTTGDLLSDSAWNAAGAQYSPAILVTITNADTLSRDSLVNNTYSVMLMPYSHTLGAGSTTLGGTGTIPKVGSCNTPPPNTPACSATITLPAGVNPNSFVLNFTDFYFPGSVKISGLDSSNGPQSFLGGQAIIDSTGKAQDVLKRLQARVPINSSTETLPGSSLEVGSVCKRIQTLPPEAGVVSNVVDAPPTAAGGSTSSCGLN